MKQEDWEFKDGFIFYRGARPFEELELPPEDAAEAEDYDWAMKDAEVQEKYAGLVVAVHRRRIWGAGRTYRAAGEQARQNPACPSDLVYVVVLGPAFEISKRNP